MTSAPLAPEKSGSEQSNYDRFIAVFDVSNGGATNRGQADLTLEGPQLAPKPLEGGLTCEQLLLEVGNLGQRGGVLEESPEPLDAELGGDDLAFEVDHSLGHIVGGDDLIPQESDVTQSAERRLKLLGRDLEREGRPRHPIGRGDLAEQHASQTLDGQGGL